MARCAFCGAEFETGPGDILLVCPYCGTAQTTEGAKFEKHYMIRVHFDRSDAERTLLDWCSKQLGAPDDLAVAARFVEAKLVFYPFWVCNVEADTRYQGLGKDARFYDRWPQRPEAFKRIEFYYKPESGRFQRRYEISIPGIEDIDEDIKRFPIPTRSREYFSHAHAEEHDGIVLHSKVSEEQAREQAKQEAYNRQTALVLEEVDKIESRDDNIKVGEAYLIHVPVWELKYRYGRSTYKASVSAATGYVIESKYPRTLAFRAAALAGGLVFLLIGAGLFYLALKQGLWYAGGLTSGSIFAAVGLGMLYKAASTKEAKEEI